VTCSRPVVTIGTLVLIKCRYYERAAGVDDSKKEEIEKGKARSELFGRLGKPCESCNVAVATLACEACACVICALCSDDIHDEDGPLASHKLERAGVRAHKTHVPRCTHTLTEISVSSGACRSPVACITNTLWDLVGRASLSSQCMYLSCRRHRPCPRPSQVWSRSRAAFPATYVAGSSGQWRVPVFVRRLAC
jgi:hypothetical protein